MSRAKTTAKNRDALSLFLSYSHKDEKFRHELDAHLALLARDGVISSWHDRMILAGEEWEGEISRELTNADVILLLISADFVNSNYGTSRWQLPWRVTPLRVGGHGVHPVARQEEPPLIGEQPLIASAPAPSDPRQTA